MCKTIKVTSGADNNKIMDKLTNIKNVDSCFTSNDLIDDALATRSDKMCELRDAVKKAKWTYSKIAFFTNKSPSFIGVCLRGDFPHSGGNRLPKFLRVWLSERGFEIHESLITW